MSCKRARQQFTEDGKGYVKKGAWIHTHTHTQTKRGREGERERNREKNKEREREREWYEMLKKIHDAMNSQCLVNTQYNPARKGRPRPKPTPSPTFFALFCF